MGCLVCLLYFSWLGFGRLSCARSLGLNCFTLLGLFRMRLACSLMELASLARFSRTEQNALLSYLLVCFFCVTLLAFRKLLGLIGLHGSREDWEIFSNDSIFSKRIPAKNDFWLDSIFSKRIPAKNTTFSTIF